MEHISTAHTHTFEYKKQQQQEEEQSNHQKWQNEEGPEEEEKKIRFQVNELENKWDDTKT